MDFELKHGLTAVELNGKTTYGGSQMLSWDKDIRRCGCGIVAVAELMLYLGRRSAVEKGIFSSAGGSEIVNLDYYNSLLNWLRKRYVPLIPPFGTTGVGLALGVNALFRHSGLSCSAKWNMSRSGLYPAIERMLAEDIPVIMAIGPDFPKFWSGERLDLYTLRQDGSYEKASSAKGHYIIVTGISPEWLRISSWGHRFYINRREYDEFTKKNSSYILSNVLEISQKA